jgi:hypothetical protein
MLAPIDSILVFGCLTTFAQAQPSTAGVARPPLGPVRSPEIGPDRSVAFRLRATGATEVSVSGEFMRGSKPLEKGADGVWSVVVGSDGLYPSRV